MTDIEVTPLDPGHYGVQVHEGDVVTSHRVTVPEGLVDELDLRDIDEPTIVRESIAYLLEREPATAIMAEFSLDDIPRYFDNYYDELAARVRA